MELSQQGEGEPGVKVRLGEVVGEGECWDDSVTVVLFAAPSWDHNSVLVEPYFAALPEAFRDTGGDFWLDKGVEQLRAAEIHGDLHRWDTRLDVQHFLSVYRDHVLDL